FQVYSAHRVLHSFPTRRSSDLLPEPANLLIVLFCLSMLARYYPDIWIRAIDTSPRIADLTDSLLNIVYRKFSNLILDQLTWTKRSEEHTSELQSRGHLVCRLLL